MPGYVTVGCKLPHGLMLQLYRMEEHQEPVMAGGYRKVRRAVQDRPPVRLNGFARYLGQDVAHSIIMGTGITHGVDADFFAEWMLQNEDSDVVKKGLIFSQIKPSEIEAQARDHKSLKSGLEPIDPSNLPPEFKGKIETADRPA
jgi:hypothetical protein